MGYYDSAIETPYFDVHDEEGFLAEVNSMLENREWSETWQDSLFESVDEIITEWCYALDERTKHYYTNDAVERLAPYADIEIRMQGEDGELYGYRARDGEYEYLRPKIVWPE